MRRFPVACARREAMFKWVVSVLLWLATTHHAAAHIVVDPTAGFEGGFAHPLTGPDHFLAMFAVGLWGAQMGGRNVWSLPVTFPLIMVVVVVLAMLSVTIPAVEIGVGLSIVALGLAIA